MLCRWRVPAGMDEADGDDGRGRTARADDLSAACVLTIGTRRHRIFDVDRDPLAFLAPACGLEQRSRDAQIEDDTTVPRRLVEPADACRPHDAGSFGPLGTSRTHGYCHGRRYSKIDDYIGRVSRGPRKVQRSLT